MEALSLESVPGKPGVFLTELNGAPVVFAFRKAEFDATEEVKTVRFRHEHVRDAKAVAAKLKLPLYVAVEVEMAGQLWASYAVPVEICGRFFPRWAFPLRNAARRVFDCEPQVIKEFRAEVVEGIAA